MRNDYLPLPLLRTCLVLRWCMDLPSCLPSLGLVRRNIAMPPARYARDRAAQQKVGNKGDRNRDDRRLGGIECLEYDGLIDHVHKQAQEDDPGGIDQPFVETFAALLRVDEDRPKVRRAASPRVLDAVVKCGDRRHGGLEDETEAH